MPTRTRVVSLPFPPGSRTRQITTNPPVVTSSNISATSQHKYRSTCDDTYGDPGNDHPLLITCRDMRDFKLLNGALIEPGHTLIYQDFIPIGGSIGTMIHQSVSLPSVSNRALTLRARTNPSREEVSIPNFLYELKDFPRMIRNIRDLPVLLRNFKHRHSAAFQQAASQYLGWEFGWKPLYNDLKDILSFQSQVDRRIVELNRLYSEKGLKRRLNLFDQTESTSNSKTIETGGGRTLSVIEYRVTRVRSWGTIRWRPTSVPKDIGRQDLGRVARKLVFGIQHKGVDGLQAWNALPFSWLIDWFSNYGEWLAAHRNVIPAAPTGPSNIMTLSETYYTWVRTDGYRDAIKGGDGVRVLRTKARAQSAGSLSATLPLATARQLGILAALNLQRKR